MNIQSIQASAQKFHGKDIKVSVAKCQAWGNDSGLAFVHGKNHIDAACDFVRAIKGAKIEVKRYTCFMTGKEFTYSQITF